NEYDAAGRVVRQTQADGGVWQFTYIAEGTTVTQTTVTDPRGSATVHRFDGQGFPLATTDALGQTTTFVYTPGSNLLALTTDPLGRTTRVTYDAQGNVTSVTDPTGNQRTFTYEPTFNKIASVRDPLGNVTSFAYDAQGNLTSVTDPLGKVTTIAYNAFGQPLHLRRQRQPLDRRRPAGQRGHVHVRDDGPGYHAFRSPRPQRELHLRPGGQSHGLHRPEGAGGHVRPRRPESAHGGHVRRR